jgi:hypothetical protein
LRKCPCAVSGRRKLKEGDECEEIFGRAGIDLPSMLSGWPDAAFEHEVELLRLADFVVGIRVSYVVFLA